MEPLTGLDATFLYAETPTTPMNVIATVVVEGRVEREVLLDRIASRLEQLPVFRRRPVETPFGLDHPAWIEDPDLDLREHVVRADAPTPGDDRALESVVAGVARRRLDRARPLWEITLVEGLAEGRSALVVKAHHAALDGVSGAALLLHLFDRDRDRDRDRAAPAAADANPAPSPGALLGHGLSRLRERPPLAWQALRRAGEAASQLARGVLAEGAPLREAALPFAAPASPWNGSLSHKRSVGNARVPLAAIRCVREAFGGTVNDVALAACSRALQQELIGRGARPDQALLAAVPVSAREPGDPAGGNRISALLARLPVQLEDPIHQLSEVCRGTRQSKLVHGLLGPRTLGALAELLPPGVARSAFELYGRWKLAGLHRPLVNVVISNVPGPPAPLSLCGLPVRALHPHGPLMEGVGLNITLMSYAGSLDVGVLACGERVPDARGLACRVAGAIEELTKLAEASLPELPASLRPRFVA